MADIDPKVASIVDRANPESDDEDALIAELEDDEDHNMSKWRERRLQQLHGEVARAKDMKNSEHGKFEEIKDEKQLMDITTQTKMCIVHFFKPDFGRCGVMDKHLETLAPLHFDTRFVKINVENAPFLVTKLNIKVLPCVLAFVNGVSTERIIGFEGLSHKPDSFTSRDLEARLLKANVLVRPKVTGDVQQSRGAVKGSQQQVNEDEDDEDWD